MLKKVALVALLFSVVIVGGCYPPEPSLHDKLRELDYDLQDAMWDLNYAIERLEKVERELSFIDVAFWSEGEVYSLRRYLSEVANNIAIAEGKLNKIVDDME